jgi:hypothetical protein
MKQFTQGENINIKVNDQLGSYFQTKKGIRQGDPMSPILFNIVVDMLTVLIARAKEAGQVEGVIPHLVQDGLSILQYADEVLLSNSQGLKLTFTRVRSFALVRQRIMRCFIRSYLDVGWVSFLSVTLVYLCTLGS